MSDCFDHILNSFESNIASNYESDSIYYEESSNLFVKNKNYYHNKIKAKIIYKTDKAYLLKNSKGLFWVSKTLCRKVKKKSLLIHKSAIFKYL